MTIPRLLAAPFFAASLLVTSTAFADDADKAACAALDEGDDCTRGDGRAGTCIPDDSDPNVLTCDDDASGLDDSSDDGGCSVGARSAAAGSPAALLAMGIGAAFALSRRSRRQNRS